MHKRFLSALILLSVAAMSNAAITFSNFTYGPDAVTAGFNTSTTPTISGNSITWQPGNAKVGYLQTAFPTGTAVIGLTYDAKSTGPAIGQVLGQVFSTTQGFVLGDGFIGFQEHVFELDAQGNEVGGPIGSVSVDTMGRTTLPETKITLTKQVMSIRVKKSFLLSASVTPGNFAGIAQVNQSVMPVPEPASMVALGLGAAAMLRRRKRA